MKETGKPKGRKRKENVKKEKKKGVRKKILKKDKRNYVRDNVSR